MGTLIFQHTPPSCLLVTPHSCSLVVLSLRCPLVISSRCLVAASPLVVPSSHPLVVPSLGHPPIVLRWLVAVLPLDVLPSCRPLIALSSRPLVACRLVVARPPSNAAVAIERPPPPPPLHAIFFFIVHCHQHRCLRHRHRHLHCQTLHPRALTKREVAAPSPLVYQSQHHREHIYKSR